MLAIPVAATQAAVGLSFHKSASPPKLDGMIPAPVIVAENIRSVAGRTLRV